MDLTEIAREWLGTKWVHHQSKKNIACDCVGFLLGVAREANLGLPDIPKPYPRLPKENAIQKYLETNFNRTDKVIKKNRILLLHFNGIYCHVAIATSNNTMIHADSTKRKVVEHIIDEVWLNKIIAIYEVKD